MIVIKATDKDRQALASVPIDAADMVDDGFDWLNKRVEKPWGHEIEKYRDERISVWWLHLKPHEETSMHAHVNKTTLLVIVAGIATLATLNGEHVVTAGNVIVIEKGAFHSTKAHEGYLVMYELESLPNKRDLVRFKDRYGRGQGYECLSVTP